MPDHDGGVHHGDATVPAAIAGGGGRRIVSLRRLDAPITSDRAHRKARNSPLVVPPLPVHSGYPKSGFVDRTTNLVEIEQPLVEVAIQNAMQADAVMREIVNGESWLYLTSIEAPEVPLSRMAPRPPDRLREGRPDEGRRLRARWGGDLVSFARGARAFRLSLRPARVVTKRVPCKRSH